MARDPKKEQLEELCRKHDVDPNSLPDEFLMEIGKNFFPRTKNYEMENHDLKTLIEFHGVDTDQNPEFFKKLDRTFIQYQEMLENQARAFASRLKEESYDELTGCYIRKRLGGLLYPLIELARKKDHNLSVMMIDIDKFKLYNDTYGHLQGDQTLTTIGNIIRNIVKSPNSAVRYGGEEFYIILPETDQDEAINMARKIRTAVERTVFKKHPTLESVEFPDEKYKHATVTLGVFTYHSGLDSILGFYEADNKNLGERGFDMVYELVNVPDQALKDAKNRNERNQVHIAKID